jgi:hypothetical protein
MSVGRRRERRGEKHGGRKRKLVYAATGWKILAISMRVSGA